MQEHNGLMQPSLSVYTQATKANVEIHLPERSNANRLSSWAIFGKISFSMDVGLSCVAKQTARKKINKPSIASPYQISK